MSNHGFSRSDRLRARSSPRSDPLWPHLGQNPPPRSSPALDRDHFGLDLARSTSFRSTFRSIKHVFFLGQSHFGPEPAFDQAHLGHMRAQIHLEIDKTHGFTRSEPPLDRLNTWCFLDQSHFGPDAAFDQAHLGYMEAHINLAIDKSHGFTRSEPPFDR